MKITSKRLPVLFLVLALLGFAPRAHSSGITFGPGEISSLSPGFTLTAATITAYTTSGVETLTGFKMSGDVVGTDSLGNPYTLGVSGGPNTFFDPFGSNQWFEDPVCTNVTCTGPLGTFLDNELVVDDCNVLPPFCTLGAGDSAGLQQDSTGGITLTFLVCAAESNNVCTATTNLVFDLVVDPVTLSTLQPGQSVTLSVTGGCVTSATSCSSGTSPTPEPGTLLLLASGLFGLAAFVRTKFGGA